MLDNWNRISAEANANQWTVPLMENQLTLLDAQSEKAAHFRHHNAISKLRNRLYELLYDGPGFALLTGFPVDDEKRAERYLMKLGSALGVPVSQTSKGEIVVRVEDAGAQANVPTHRGHRTSSALPFHVDRTDVIVLLCVRQATSGGQSRIVSSRYVHDVLQSENPSLLETLKSPMPHDRRGEQKSNEQAWCLLPIFSEDRGRIVCRYIRRFIESSQRHADAPRLTFDQAAALDALDEVLSRRDTALSMDLKPGEVQLIENHSVLHARSSFHNEQTQRLLLRLWLSTPKSPRLPPEFAPLYGNTAPGTVRGGVWPESSDSYHALAPWWVE